VQIMLLGLVLALACALVTNAGFLVRHRGAVEAPPVRRWRSGRAADSRGAQPACL